MHASEELRAGNVVLHKLSGYPVKVITAFKNWITFETIPHNSICDFEDLAGIILTSLILKQLSFTNEAGTGSWHGQGLSIHARADGFFYGLRINRNRYKIKYLHQLQNYFSDYQVLFKNVRGCLLVDNIMYLPKLAFVVEAEKIM